MIKVTPILGVVEVSGQGALADTSKPANNSTRWMFDIEGSLGLLEGQEQPEELLIQLVRSGQKVLPDMLAGSFLPLSAEYHDAKPFIYGIEGGLLAIRHKTQEQCMYRVMIDVLHTATR